MNKVQNSAEYKVIDGKYEYYRSPLKELESKYIYMPLSIITGTELDIKRAAVFAYLRIHCGLNNIVGFTVPDIVEWCGGKIDKRINGTNDKFLTTMDALNDRGYLTYLTKRSRSSFMKCEFNTDYYFEECSDGYAVLYLDEIKKIMNYKKEGSENTSLNNATMLLVFAYFRNKIKRRPNELKPEERNPEGIKKRKERLPDAYYGNVNDIADEIGIHKQTLSKIIDILEYELELIVTDRPYRIKNEDDEYRTPPTIFANAYKREDKYLLSTGKEYGRKEIELKAENMKYLYHPNYKIDIRKRKNERSEK